MMIAKVVTFDRLTSDLYAAVFIIAIFIELKDEAKLTELGDFTILLNEDDFSLSQVTTEEIDLFSIWVEIELFCSIAIFLLERTVELLEHDSSWDRNYDEIERSSQHDELWASKVMITCQWFVIWDHWDHEATLMIQSLSWRDHSATQTIARIFYVYITMIVSLDRSFVLNSCK